MGSSFIVIATSDDGDSQAENVDNTGSDEANEQEQEQEQDRAEENDNDGEETDNENVVSEPENVCPAVAFEGPSYTDESGCSQPCPPNNQGGLPEGCPRPTEETETDSTQDTSPTLTPNKPVFPFNQDNGLVTQPPRDIGDIIIASDTQDGDNDGIPNPKDNCVLDPNPDQKDSDGDGEGDACDRDLIDSDNDGVVDARDNCPVVRNPDQKDSDGDGDGDVCDWKFQDSDKDGILDGKDNCIYIPNADQKDNDHDGRGNVCDNVDVVERPTDFGGAVGPLSEDTGVVRQPRPLDNIGDLVAPSTSESPTAPANEKGILEEGPLPGTLTKQRTPDTLFKGHTTGPTGVPLPDPVLVPGPNEERGDEEDLEEGDECITLYCDFPYPVSQDEICRNGVDDDRDGKVDEEYPCTEVPGQSKPRGPNDGVLTPEISQGPSPFGPPPK